MSGPVTMHVKRPSRCPDMSKTQARQILLSYRDPYGKPASDLSKLLKFFDTTVSEIELRNMRVDSSMASLVDYMRKLRKSYKAGLWKATTTVNAPAKPSSFTSSILKRFTTLTLKPTSASYQDPTSRPHTPSPFSISERREPCRKPSPPDAVTPLGPRPIVKSPTPRVSGSASVFSPSLSTQPAPWSASGTAAASSPAGCSRTSSQDWPANASPSPVAPSPLAPPPPPCTVSDNLVSLNCQASPVTSPLTSPPVAVTASCDNICQHSQHSKQSQSTTRRACPAASASRAYRADGVFYTDLSDAPPRKPAAAAADGQFPKRPTLRSRSPLRRWIHALRKGTPRNHPLTMSTPLLGRGHATSSVCHIKF